MFKFKDENKETNIQKVKIDIEALTQKIPQLKSMEVGADFMHSARSFDLVLYSKFETEKDLAIYDAHPEHQKVVSFIKQVIVESKAVDYMLNK
jgi:hypothetical protein